MALQETGQSGLPAWGRRADPFAIVEALDPWWDLFEPHQPCPQVLSGVGTEIPRNLEIVPLPGLPGQLPGSGLPPGALVVPGAAWAQSSRMLLFLMLL